jgi:purine-binding chemotaxis protein CheW
MALGNLNTVLLLRSPDVSYALPLKDVIETMRPLPIQPVADTPDAVLGLSVIRGEAVPVIDIGLLLGMAPAKPARFVLARGEKRHFALAVTGAVSIASFEPGAWRELPPLAHGVQLALIDQIAVVDRELVLLLNALRIVPAEVWGLLTEKAGQ